MNNRTMANCGVTLGLVAMVVASTTSGVSAKTTMSAAPTAKQLMEGKSLISSKRCNGCHGKDLTGIGGFSPSIRVTGVLQSYNQNSFEVVMDTGRTSDGGHVQKPMPIYHMKAAQADAVYAYLKSLK